MSEHRMLLNNVTVVIHQPLNPQLGWPEGTVNVYQRNYLY